MRVKSLCNFLIRYVHSPVRKYNKHGELEEYYGQEKEHDPLLCDSDFTEILLQKSNKEYPVIYLEKYPIYYGIVSDNEVVYIMGPVVVAYGKKMTENRSCGEYLAEKHKTNELSHCVSFCKYEDFCEGVLLLYNELSDGELTYQELNQYNFLDDQLKNEAGKDVGKLYFDYQENEKIHNPYDRECREMESIKNGDVESLKKSLNEVFAGEYAVLSKNELRASKNLAIVGLAISCRAAIKGGMLPEEAFTINDSYILKVDESDNIGHIEALVQRAKYEYAEIISKSKERKQKKPLIEACKKVIFKNMHQKIEVKSIAEELHVTPEYLSRLFRQETGKTLQEYIMEKKIESTKSLLMYSKNSIGSISNYFGFCSQSHFAREFKKREHMTPMEFRNCYGVSEFQK